MSCEGAWVCPKCTLLNLPNKKHCKVCINLRAHDGRAPPPSPPAAAMATAWAYKRRKRKKSSQSTINVNLQVDGEQWEPLQARLSSRRAMSNAKNDTVTRSQSEIVSVNGNENMNASQPKNECKDDASKDVDMAPASGEPSTNTERTTTMIADDVVGSNDMETENGDSGGPKQVVGSAMQKEDDLVPTRVERQESSPYYIDNLHHLVNDESRRPESLPLPSVSTWKDALYKEKRQEEMRKALSVVNSAGPRDRAFLEGLLNVLCAKLQEFELVEETNEE